MNRVERRFRRLLRLVPASVREAHGDEILEMARAEHARARAGGPWSRLSFWPRLVADVLRAGLRASRPSAVSASPASSRPAGAALEWRLAWRALRATPGTSLLIVTTLALGIGLTTAVFSAVHGVIYRPLAYRDAGRLVALSAPLNDGQGPDARFSGQAFAHVRSTTQAMADVAAITLIRQNLIGGDRAVQVDVGWVSHNFLDLLGTKPLEGRLLGEGDPPGTAMLSEAIWTQAFGRRANVIGSSIRLDGRGYTVVGIVPASFALHLPGLSPAVDVWKVPDNWWQNGNVWEAAASGNLRVIGRLAPGRDVAAAIDEASRLTADLRARVPEYERSRWAIRVTPLLDGVSGPVRTPLLLLLASVMLVLLVACANVMNLLLVRAQGRHRELAVRLALGSSRPRLVGGLLVESLVLAVAGGVAGLGVMAAARTAITALAHDVPRVDDGPGLAVFACAAGAVLFCTLAGGVAPALWTSRVRTADLAVRTTIGRSRQRISQALVVLQVATSLVLLVGAGLLGVSLMQTARVDPGFDPSRLATFAVSLPSTTYQWPAGTNQFLRRFEEELEALPGVESAGVVWPLPLGGSQWLREYAGGVVRSEDQVRARHHTVTPDYFETVGTPIVDGRNFGPEDPKTVVIVSEQLAARAWPGERAVGRYIEADPFGNGKRRMQVIGVAADVRFRSLRDAPEQVIYLDAGGWSWTDWQFDVVVRTANDPLTIIPAARDVLARLDPDLPLAEPRRMTDYVNDQLAPGRVALGVVGLFAALAALLAALGLYGVLSHAVEHRRREIVIRVALGSAPGAIVRMLVAQGLRLVAIGLALGVAASLWATRLLGAYLYGVEPTSPATYAAVVTAFVLIALAACSIPARRALAVSVQQVLR